MSGGWIPSGLTRRGRRRLFVVATAGVMGLGVPQWMPRLLATLPAFQVEHVKILGTRHVAPDEINHLLALEADASVWDSVDPLERRVREHPMIREATVRREGLNALSVIVVEKRPVALVATPELKAVNGSGVVLPLEPFMAGLNLPIISGVTEVEDDVVLEPAVREMAGVLDQLVRVDPGFVSVVSEIGPATGGGYGFTMLPAADAEVVLLPSNEPVRALQRVALALGRTESARVARADARYSRQVVLTPMDGR